MYHGITEIGEVTMTGETRQISYRSELTRKTIHLTSLLIPILYLRVPHSTGIQILLTMAGISLFIDVLRHYHTGTRAILERYLGAILRTHEKTTTRFTLTGATWVLLAAVLSFSLFPTVVAVTIFTVLIVSDSFAALIGRRFPRKPFFDKSVAGTAAFIVSAWCVVTVYALVYSLPFTYYGAGALGAIAAGIAESASVRLKADDNIVIPLSMAIVMLVVNELCVLLGYASFYHSIP
ncbi:MAG: phosphatidate cytidylyltransferase [Ignavibacteria bacterium]